jgi:hypothetical protein
VSIVTNPTFSREFLSELNQVITTDQWSQSLYDLLTPIRNCLLAETNLLSYSIARHAGAPIKIAFFAEWNYQILRLTADSKILLEENRKYFRKKVPVRLRGVPGLYDLIDKHINEIFQPKQNILMNLKSEELMNQLGQNHEYYKKYFSKEFLAKFQQSEMLGVRPLYQETVNVSQYLEAQGMRLSFIKIGLPVLLGFLHTFYLVPKNSTKAIRWVLLEEVLRGISTLHQTGETKDLQKFIYASRLNEKEEFQWWQNDESKQLQIALSSTEAREISKEAREKIYQNTKNNLASVGLSTNQREILEDLLNWTYKMG